MGVTVTSMTEEASVYVGLAVIEQVRSPSLIVTPEKPKLLSNELRMFAEESWKLPEKAYVVSAYNGLLIPSTTKI